MAVLRPGAVAPALDDVDFTAGPTAVFFYKVSCPVCQMAAPKVSAFARGYPGRIVGVGQDPQEKLADFEATYSMGVPAGSDAPPYDLSNAYGIEVVPTTFLVGTDGLIVDTVESWDRDGLNRLSGELADLTGRPYVAISEPGDGLPPFRPG